jgi:hypothetical protein
LSCVEIDRDRPVAADDDPPSGANEGAHQPVQRKVAFAGHAGGLGPGLAAMTGGVAGRENDEVGVEPKIINLGKCEQAVGARAIEAGQQGRLRGAFLARSGHQAMGGKMENAELVEVRLGHDARVREVCAGHDFGSAAAGRQDHATGGEQFVGGDRAVPGGSGHEQSPRSATPRVSAPAW